MIGTLFDRGNHDYSMLHKAFMLDGVCVTGTGFIVDETVDALGRPLATSKKTMFGAKIHDRSDAKLKDNDKGNEKDKEKENDKIRSEENTVWSQNVGFFSL